MAYKYLYEKIYNDLVDSINSGIYKPGDRLPTEYELASKYNVSRITSQKALKLLTEAEIVVRNPGIGTIVKDNVESVNLTKAKKDASRKIIGLVVEAFWHSYGIGIFDGVYDLAKEYNMDIVVKKSYGDQSEEINAITELVDMGASGIIVMSAHGMYYSEELLKLIIEKYPVVFIDRYLNGIHAPFVGSNNFDGSKKAVEYLINEKKNPKLALVTDRVNRVTSLEERYNGFIETCSNNKVEYEIFDKAHCIIPHSYENSDSEAIIIELVEFFKNNGCITGVIATEYSMASLVREAIKISGKKIKDDIEVICFDSPYEHLGKYEFTHIRQNEVKIGQEALKLINKLINKEETEDKILVDIELVKGKSTNN